MDLISSMEILFNIFTQYSILVMNGCFDQNTRRKFNTRLHSLFSYHFQNIAAPFIIKACCGFFLSTKTRTLPDLNLWTNSLSMPRPHAPVEFSEHRSVMFVCPHSVNGQLTSDIQLYLSERNGENKLGRNPLEPQKTTRRDSRHKKSVLFIRKKWSWIARWPIFRDKQRILKIRYANKPLRYLRQSLIKVRFI